MPVDIADVIDAARVSELPPLRGLEEMISTFLFIVMLSLLFLFHDNTQTLLEVKTFSESKACRTF